ncbi:MAG TPA: M48 family metalloprotease [Tepidisphaeraceae bacterium]|nr:M48 family metalloprotease [Tepidisphaeraceae bacterium]
MNAKISRNARLFAAGSLTAAVVALAFVPFNMGGCSASNLNIGSIVQGGGKLIAAGSLSEKDEQGLGEAVAVRATNTYPIYPDQNLNRYVTLVGRTVGAASPEPKLKLYFAVLNTDKANAFSGPHGFIFITRGAIRRMHDESELAGVLGHEIGHVVKHHGLDAVKKAGYTDAFMTAAKGNVKQLEAFSNTTDALVDAAMNTGYGQPQEEQADAEGVKYVIAAGYDPDGYLHFLQRLQQEQGAGGSPFGTHPGIKDRIKLVSEQIAKAHAGGQGQSLPERFHQYFAAATPLTR